MKICVDCGVKVYKGPRCPSCGCKVREKRKRETGYECSDQTRKKLSIAAKKQWDDPDSVIAGAKERLRRSDSLKSKWATDGDPIHSAHAGFMRSNAAKRRCMDPDWRRTLSVNTKHQWASGCFDARLGHCHSTETKAKISAASKAYWSDPETRANQSKVLKHAFANPEVQRRHSAGLRHMWSKPEHRLSMAKAIEHSHSISNHFQLHPSSLEMRLAHAMDRLDVVYKQQYRPDGYWRFYDFFIPDQNLLIEVDGTYWHSLPKSKKIDREKDLMSTRLGFDFLRISEEDLNIYDAEEVVRCWILEVYSCC